MRVTYEGGVGSSSFEGDDLRAASRAVEHAVGKAAHLRVAALACVRARSVR
jgi:hypothetical protein